MSDTAVKKALPTTSRPHGLHAPRTRWGAFGIHFGISVLIFVVLVTLIVGWLFPGALFGAAGGWQGVRIIAGVDLVLGPLLTLIVYNVAKPRREMVRDLSVIGTIQIVALLAGMYIVYSQRPVGVTWVNDRFYVVDSRDYRDAEVQVGELEQYRLLAPFLNYIEMPDSAAQIETVLMSYSLTGEKPQTRMDLSNPMPTETDKAGYIMRYNQQRAIRTEQDCVPALVVSRFGDSQLCYDLDRQRFFRLQAVATSSGS